MASVKGIKAYNNGREGILFLIVKKMRRPDANSNNIINFN